MMSNQSSSSTRKPFKKYTPLQINTGRYIQLWHQLCDPTRVVHESEPTHTSNSHIEYGITSSVREQGHNRHGGNAERKSEEHATWPVHSNGDRPSYNQYRYHNRKPSNEQRYKNDAERSHQCGKSDTLPGSSVDGPFRHFGREDRLKLNKSQSAQRDSRPSSGENSKDGNLPKNKLPVTGAKKKTLPLKETAPPKPPVTKGKARRLRQEKILQGKQPRVLETNDSKSQQTKASSKKKKKNFRRKNKKGKKKKETWMENKKQKRIRKRNGKNAVNSQPSQLAVPNPSSQETVNINEKMPKENETDLPDTEISGNNPNSNQIYSCDKAAYNEQSRMLDINLSRKRRNIVGTTQNENRTEKLNVGKENENETQSNSKDATNCSRVANNRPHGVGPNRSPQIPVTVDENKTGNVYEEDGTGAKSNSRKKHQYDKIGNNRDRLVLDPNHPWKGRVQSDNTAETSIVGNGNGAGSSIQTIHHRDKIKNIQDRIVEHPSFSPPKNITIEEQNQRKNTETTSNMGLGEGDKNENQTKSQRSGNIEESRTVNSSSGAMDDTKGSDKARTSPVPSNSSDTEEYYGNEFAESPEGTSSGETVCKCNLLQHFKQEKLSQGTSSQQRSCSKGPACSLTTDDASKSPLEGLTPSQMAVARNIKKEPLGDVQSGSHKDNDPPLEESLSNESERVGGPTEEVNVRNIKQQPPDEDMGDEGTQAGQGGSPPLRCTCKLEPASQTKSVGGINVPASAIQRPISSYQVPTQAEQKLPDASSVAKQKAHSTNNDSPAVTRPSSATVGDTSMGVSSLAVGTREQLPPPIQHSSLLSKTPPHPLSHSSSENIPIPHLSTAQLSVFTVNVDKSSTGASNVLPSRRANDSMSNNFLDSVSIFPCGAVEGNVLPMPSLLSRSVYGRIQLITPPLAVSSPSLPTPRLFTEIWNPNPTPPLAIQRPVSNSPISATRITANTSADSISLTEGLLSSDRDVFSTSPHHSTPSLPLPSFPAEGVTFLVNHYGDIDERLNQVPFDLESYSSPFGPCPSAMTDGASNKSNSMRNKDYKLEEEIFATEDYEYDSNKQPNTSHICDNVPTSVKKKKKHKKSKRDNPHEDNSETLFQSRETEHDCGTVEVVKNSYEVSRSSTSLALEESVPYKKKRKKKSSGEIELPDAETGVETEGGKRKKKKKKSSSFEDENSKAHSDIWLGTNLDYIALEHRVIDQMKSEANMKTNLCKEAELEEVPANFELIIPKKKAKKKEKSETDLDDVAAYLEDFEPVGLVEKKHEKFKRKKKDRRDKSDEQSRESGLQCRTSESEILTEIESTKSKSRKREHDVEERIALENVDAYENEVRTKKKKKKDKRKDNEEMENNSAMPPLIDDVEDDTSPKKKKSAIDCYANEENLNDEPQLKKKKKKRKHLEMESPCRGDRSETKQDSVNVAFEDSAQYQCNERKKKKCRDRGEDIQIEPAASDAEIQLGAELEGSDLNASGDTYVFQTLKHKKKKYKVKQLETEEYYFAEAQRPESDNVVYESRKKKKKKRSEASHYSEKSSNLEIRQQEFDPEVGNFQEMKKKKKHKKSRDSRLEEDAPEELPTYRTATKYKGEGKRSVNMSATLDQCTTSSHGSKKRFRDPVERTVDNVSITTTIMLGHVSEVHGDSTEIGDRKTSKKKKKKRERD